MKIFGIDIKWPGGHKGRPDMTPPPRGPITMVGERYLIDVRTKEEWNRDHIQGTILIPHDQIGKRLPDIIADRQAPIALFCRSGRRSAIALDVVKAIGYKHVENLGGIQDARNTLRNRSYPSHPNQDQRLPQKEKSQTRSKNDESDRTLERKQKT